MLAEYYRKWSNKGRGVYLILGVQFQQYKYAFHKNIKAV